MPDCTDRRSDRRSDRRPDRSRDPRVPSRRRRGCVAAVAASLIGLSLAGCDQGTSDRDVKLLGVTEAQQLVANPTGLFRGGNGEGVWVDPRSRADFADGHIPGAISMPFQEARDRYREVRGYSAVVVYGADYGDPKAVAMSKRLIELGVDNVRVMDGGLEAWRNAGFSLEQGMPEPTPEP